VYLNFQLYLEQECPAFSEQGPLKWNILHGAEGHSIGVFQNTLFQIPMNHYTTKPQQLLQTACF